MANKISQVLSFEAKEAIQALVDVEGGLDSVENKGKLVAKALDTMATDIDADLKGSAAAADALGAALGPELVAKIGQGGVEDFVVKLKSIGLTSDQIVTDVDDLAASIKHLDDIGRNLDGPKQGLKDVASQADHTKGKLHDMGGEADNSRSVMANMVGNSAQDIAGLGGVAGTAGMALGQLGEYAAEGNISLSGLAKVAGPMALVTVAAMGIQHTMGELAATKAFNTKQVEDWTTAIKEGKDAIDDLATSAADAGKIEFRSMGDTKDLVPVLQELGLKATDFFAAVKGGEPAIATFIQQAKDAGASQGQLYDIIFAVTEQAKNHRDAVEHAGAQQDVFGQKAEEAGKKAELASKNYDAQVATTSAAVQAEIDAMTAKWDEINGHINAEKSMIQYKQQVDDVRQAIADAGQAELDHGVGSPEAIAAREAARLKTLELESTTASLGATILGLPPEQVTKLIAEIDRGNLDNLPGIIQSKLDERTYRIKAHLDSIVIDGETHAAGSTTLHVGGTSKVISSAAGGYFPPKPGGYLVNLAEAGKGEWVVPEDQMRGGGGPGGPVTIINVYVAGSVMAERDLARSVADGIVDGQRRGEITAGFLVSP